MRRERREREREREVSRERNPISNSNPNQNSNSKANSINLSTIYVSNLPLKLDKFGLRGICSRIGRVDAASIPDNQKGRKRFGFVKFENHVVAGKSIQVLNNKSVRGCKLWVQFARRDFSRVRHEYPSKGRQESRSAPNQSFNKQEGVEIGDLLVFLKKNIAVEVGNLVKVRKDLVSYLEKIEGLLASNSVQLQEGVHPEVADIVNSVAPVSTPSLSKSNTFQNSPKPNSPKISFVDALVGIRDVHPDNCNDVVVDDSPSQSKTFLSGIEEGEGQAKGLIDKVRESLEVESAEADGAKTCSDSLPDLGYPSGRKSPSPTGVGSQEAGSGSAVNSEDRLRARAIRTQDIGHRLEEKGITGEKNEAVCLRQAIMIMQQQKKKRGMWNNALMKKTLSVS